MAVGIAALGGIAECEDKSLIAARQVLQAQIPSGREFDRLAGQIGDRGVFIDRHRFILNKTFIVQDVIQNAWHVLIDRIFTTWCLGRCLAIGHQGEIQQTMGVVKGRAQNLSAGQVLEGCRNSARYIHFGGFDWLGKGKTWQRRAIGPHQKNRLDQITTGLLDGKGGQIAIIKRPFGHDPGDGQRELLFDLIGFDFGDGLVAAALLGQKLVRIIDGAFATFYCNIHD